MYAQLRPAPPPPGASFQALHLRTPAFRPAWHLHDEYELNFIARGRGTRWIGRAAAPFGPGDVVLVPPGLPHSWASDPASDGEPAEAIVVLFAPDLLGGADGPPEWRAVRRLLGEAEAGLEFDDADGAIGAALRTLAALRGAPALLALLGCLDRLAGAGRAPLSGSAAPGAAGDLAVVRRALDLMRARELSSQAAAASRLGLSPSRLSRLFRRATGRTYSQHLDARRIDVACALLQEGELRVGQIAFEAGFGNLSNFNRRFRAVTGRTPRDYRRAFSDAVGQG